MIETGTQVLELGPRFGFTLNFKKITFIWGIYRLLVPLFLGPLLVHFFVIWIILADGPTNEQTD